METTTLFIAGASVAAVAFVGYNWISIYNKFQYWFNLAQRKFADIDVAMQQRIDLLPALAQAVKKYDIHEYKALKDVIEARSRWSKDLPLNEKVKAAQTIDNRFLSITALMERYPQLKAVILHKKLMGRGSISKVERYLRQERLEYNQVVQKYNERVCRFPRNIVAWVHGFNKLEYLTLGNQINQGPQEPYKPTKLFDD